MPKIQTPTPTQCALAGLFISILCAIAFGWTMALLFGGPDFKPYALVIEDDCYIDDQLKIAPADTVETFLETETKQTP